MKFLKSRLLELLFILCAITMVVSWFFPGMLLVGHDFGQVKYYVFQRVTMICSFNGYFQIADFPTSERGSAKWEWWGRESFPKGRFLYLGKVDGIYTDEFGAAGVYLTASRSSGPLSEPIYSLTIHYGWILFALGALMMVRRLRNRRREASGFEVMQSSV